MAKIVNFHGGAGDAGQPRLHDLPAMLRRLADDLEKGDPPDARNAVVVVECEGLALAVYGFGPDGGDGVRAAGLMEWGKHWLMRMALDDAE